MMGRLGLLLLVILGVLGVAVVHAQRASLPIVWWGRPLNQGLAEGWVGTGGRAGGGGGVPAERASLPIVWWGRPLNQGLAEWWMVTGARSGGLATLRNLANPREPGTLTAMAAGPTATSGVGATSRVGGVGELRMDGTDDSVVMSAAPLTGLTSFTVAIWVQTTVVVSDRMFIAKGGGADFSWTLTTGNPTGTSVRMAAFDCAGSVFRVDFTTPNLAINDGRWHH